jgi:hypothetical protein
MADEEVKQEEIVETGPCKCECCDHTLHEKPATSWFWIKDSAGNASATVTFAAIAFWVTTLAYLLSIVEKIGPLEVRPFDVAACGTYMIPILGLYFGRRWTDAKLGSK